MQRSRAKACPEKLPICGRIAYGRIHHLQPPALLSHNHEDPVHDMKPLNYSRTLGALPDEVRIILLSTYYVKALF